AGLEGQDGGLAVHTGVAQPGLGRADEARLDEAALIAGVLADGVIAGLVPGELESAGGHLGGAWGGEERRQQGPVLDLPGLDDLGDGEELGRAGPLAGGGGVNVGEGAVGGAQVDANDVSRGHGFAPMRNGRLNETTLILYHPRSARAS